MAAFLSGQPVKIIQTPKKSCSGVIIGALYAAIKDKMACTRVDFNRVGRALGRLTELPYRYYRYISPSQKKRLNRRVGPTRMKPLRFGSTRNLRRLASIASMPFVFAFIAFNILDLDGSNL